MKWILSVVSVVIILCAFAFQGYSQTSDPEYYFTSITFSPDGKHLAAGTWEGIVKIWDTGSWKNVKTIPKMTKDISLLNYSPDGKFLIAAANGKDIIIWDTELWQKSLYFKAHEKKITSINVSPDGGYIITASEEPMLKAWEIKTGKELWRIEPEACYSGGGNRPVASTSLSSDGVYLAVLEKDCMSVNVYDIKSLKKVKNTSDMTRNIKTGSGFTPQFDYLVFIPGSHTLLIAYDDAVMTLNIDKGTSEILDNFHVYNRQWSPTDYLIVSPDGKFCAFRLGWNGKKLVSVAVYNTAERKLTVGLTGDSITTSAVFSPDNEYVAAAGHNTYQIQIWNIESGSLVVTLGTKSTRKGK